MRVGPQASHQGIIFLANALFTPLKNKFYGFALADTKQMLGRGKGANKWVNTP